MAVAQNGIGGTYIPPGGSGNTAPPVFGDPATFGAAVNTQGSDYDKIMAGYANLAQSYSSNPTAPSISAAQVQSPSSIAPSSISSSPSTNFNSTNYNPATAQLSQYKQSGDVTGSLADLSNLAATGGYSDANIADIRARDTSPIRSIYANAQQNAERAKALGGGYSPNFNASQASMARDEANQIGN